MIPNTSPSSLLSDTPNINPSKLEGTFYSNSSKSTLLGTIINAINLSSLLILAIIGAQWAHCTTHLNSCVQVQMDLYLGKEGVAYITMAL